MREMDRRREPELMDQPGLEAGAHAQALRGLARINRFSRSADVLWRPVREALLREARPMRLLDVACGGGDVAVRLRLRAKRAGLALEVTGCDVSETALAVARRRAEAAGVDVRLERVDVLGEDLPGRYDAVTCGLFMHHLDPPEVVMLLGKMAAAARLVLVDDLVRSRAALLGAHVAVRVLSRSRVVHVDGPRSVRAAYTPEELREMAAAAGMAGATVARHFPARMLLTWRQG